MSNAMFMNPKAQLDTIETAVAAIKTRGQFKHAYLLNPGAVYTDLVNVTGKGKLIWLMVKMAAAGAGEVKIKVDGVQGLAMAVGVAQPINWIVLGPCTADNYEGYKSEIPEPINLEFNTSLQVEVKSTADDVHFHAICQED